MQGIWTQVTHMKGGNLTNITTTLHYPTNNIVCDCCVMVMTETWLHPAILDAAVQLKACTIHHYDRNSNSSKSRDGG